MLPSGGAVHSSQGRRLTTRLNLFLEGPSLNGTAQSEGAPIQGALSIALWCWFAAIEGEELLVNAIAYDARFL
jgi:hypothetical protein